MSQVVPSFITAQSQFFRFSLRSITIVSLTYFSNDSNFEVCLETIHLSRQHFLTISDPPTSEKSKNSNECQHFPDTPTQFFADVIYGWSLTVIYKIVSEETQKRF